MNTGDNLPPSAKLLVGDLVLDTGKRQVSRAGNVIPLPKLSFRLFVALATSAPDVLTHQMLTDLVWNGRSVSADTIMQRIKLLRRALGDDANQPKYVGLVRGQGYRMLQSITIADVEERVSEIELDPIQNDVGIESATRQQWNSKYSFVIASIAILLFAISLFWAGRASYPVPQNIDAAVAISTVPPDANPILLDDQAHPLKVPDSGPDVRAAYLQGTQLLRRRTGATIEAAIAQFKEAIRQDGNYAPAHVGLADGYQLLPSYSSHSAKVLLPLALESAKTALEIDSKNGEAHASLAMIYFESRRVTDNSFDIEDPEPLFLRSLELTPDYPTGNQWYGEYLAANGRQVEAIKYFERAAELDPTSPIINHLLAHSLWNMGRIEEAETRFRNSVSIDPGFARGYQGLAALYFVDRGQLADAALAAKQAVLLNRAGSTNFALLGNIYIHLGEIDEVERWVAEASRLNPDEFFTVSVEMMLRVYRQEHAEAAAVARKGLTIAPRNRMFLNVIKNQYLLENDVSAAIDLYEEAFPEFVETGMPNEAESSNRAAVDFARVLQAAGRDAEASLFLKHAHAFVESQSASRLYKTHVLHAAIHSLSNEPQLALQSLRHAVDLGWRRNSFYHFEQDPNFDKIRDEAEFQLMAAEVRADLAKQRQELDAVTESDLISKVHIIEP